MSEKYIATDVETTGLDPHSGDLLLEIAVYVVEPVYPYTAADPDGFHAVIKHDRANAYEQADEYVRQMHERTGLWDRLETGIPEKEVDHQLLEYLQRHIGQREGRITGNSVRLDMAFIDTYLPATAAWLHYRIADISSIAYWAHQEFGVPYYNKRQVHAARDDIEESLAELRHVREGIAAALGAAPETCRT